MTNYTKIMSDTFRNNQLFFFFNSALMLYILNWCISDLLLKIQEKIFKSVFRYPDKDNLLTHVIVNNLDTDNTAPKKITKWKKMCHALYSWLSKR